MSESETPKFKVGDQVTYTRVAGEVVTAPVINVYDWDAWWRETPPWPKPRHCRFLYRVDAEHGPRTVCECRLSPAEDIGGPAAPVFVYDAAPNEDGSLTAHFTPEGYAVMVAQAKALNMTVEEYVNAAIRAGLEGRSLGDA